jgi:hypothetical protein
MGNQPERRELSFSSLDDAVAEAERLAGGEPRTTGNHTFAQILDHLALSHQVAMGQATPPRPPFIMRMLMPFLKPMILNGPVKPGFKLPKDAESFFWPNDDSDVQEALNRFKKSVEDYKANGAAEVHPIFGKVTKEQMNRLNIGHCAMHLSFVHPA